MDHIFVRDFRLQALIGFHRRERVVPQTLRLDLEIGIEVMVPLGAPTFELAPLGDVFTPAPVAGRLTLGAHVDVR